MSDHIFLTGKKQVGKSTLLRRLIREKGLYCTGFETRPLIIGGERKGFTLHALAQVPAWQQDVIISARVGERQSVPVTEAFELCGTAILKASRQDNAPVILMDELGKMEKNAAAFSSAVLETLDCGKPVLGVLQQCDSPLVQAVAARPDVHIFEVTEENRDAIFAQLVALTD